MLTGQIVARRLQAGWHMSRAIRHAFDALEALNVHQALRIAEIARVLGLPRSTTVRAVVALERFGYIERRRDDARYVLTDRVLHLSSGYSTPLRIVALARPVLDALCHEVHWPMTLALPRGTGLHVYYTTDALTPHKLFTSTAGIELPIRDTASGLVYLAFVDEATRELLLESSERPVNGNRFSRSDAELLAAIDQVRRNGHFIQHHSFVQSKQFDGFQTKECLLAVPMLAGQEIVGVLAARMVTRAIKRDWIETHLAPKLKAAAAAIVAAELAERAAPAIESRPSLRLRATRSAHV
jgi:IclR family transcriptional regulator, mhp operon transcriptional activator